MNIRMLKTTPGSLNGLVTQDFIKNQVYDMSEPPGALDLARVFVDELRVAEIVKGEAWRTPAGTGGDTPPEAKQDGEQDATKDDTGTQGSADGPDSETSSDAPDAGGHTPTVEPEQTTEATAGADGDTPTEQPESEQSQNEESKPQSAKDKRRARQNKNAG